MPISLVLFDMDDVLCHYDRSARVRHLSALSGRTQEEVVHAIWTSGLEARADAGIVDDAEYLRETSNLLGCHVSEQDWLQARRTAMSPNVEVLALAEAVSAECHIAVLTNNPRIVAMNIEYLCPPVAHLFGTHVYASASFKSAKPAAQTFLRCLGTLGMSPQETLFVDDLEANVDGARQAGLDAHVFTHYGLLFDCLKEHGLLER